MAKGVCGSSSLEINFCTIGDYVRLVSHAAVRRHSVEFIIFICMAYGFHRHIFHIRIFSH